MDVSKDSISAAVLAPDRDVAAIDKMSPIDYENRDRKATIR